MDCTSQTHRLEDVLTPPSVTSDGCAPYLVLKFLQHLLFCISTRTSQTGGGGLVSVPISRNWRSKGLRGIRSLRNSMSIENV